MPQVEVRTHQIAWVCQALDGIVLDRHELVHEEVLRLGLGEADEPQLIREAVFEEIDRLINEGIDEKDFQRVKKSAYGVMVRELNNVEAVASLMLNAYMENVSPYDAISIMSEITCGDVIEFMRSQLRRDRCVLSVIETEA